MVDGSVGYRVVIVVKSSSFEDVTKEINCLKLIKIFELIPNYQDLEKLNVLPAVVVTSVVDSKTSK